MYRDILVSNFGPSTNHEQSVIKGDDEIVDNVLGKRSSYIKCRGQLPKKTDKEHVRVLLHEEMCKTF